MAMAKVPKVLRNKDDQRIWLKLKAIESMMRRKKKKARVAKLKGVNRTKR